MKHTIAIDFDGVIHKSRHGWKDGTIYDEPVPGAKEAILALHKKGFRLICFTARENVDSVQSWLYNTMGLSISQIQVTNQKPPALIYIDDRGYRFVDWQHTTEDLYGLGVMDYAKKTD